VLIFTTVAKAKHFAINSRSQMISSDHYKAQARIGLLSFEKKAADLEVVEGFEIGDQGSELHFKTTKLIPSA
jgi:hypothetical protein